MITKYLILYSSKSLDKNGYCSKFL